MSSEPLDLDNLEAVTEGPVGVNPAAMIGAVNADTVGALEDPKQPALPTEPTPRPIPEEPVIRRGGRIPRGDKSTATWFNEMGVRCGSKQSVLLLLEDMALQHGFSPNMTTGLLANNKGMHLSALVGSINNPRIVIRLMQGAATLAESSNQVELSNPYSLENAMRNGLAKVTLGI